jgi:hypothetical protein
VATTQHATKEQFAELACVFNAYRALAEAKMASQEAKIASQGSEIVRLKRAVATAEARASEAERAAQGRFAQALGPDDSEALESEPGRPPILDVAAWRRSELAL